MALTAVALLVAFPALAGDGPDFSGRLWAAPEGTAIRRAGPYGGGVDLAGLYQDAGRSEAVARLTRHGLVLEGSLRGVTDRQGNTAATLVATELYQEVDVAGQHFTLGKKVTSWDVAFGFRPLDVVQQELRLAFRPFTLEGIPQLAWEWLDQRWDVTVLWAQPLQGQRDLPVHDESVAFRIFRRMGPADLHLVGRFSERTRVQAGAGLVGVVGDTLELHASARWQERSEHVPGPDRGPGGSPISSVPPGPPSIRWNEISAVAGFTYTPGLDVSILGEGWLDQSGDRAATWRDRRRLAEEQRALGESGAVPKAAVAGNLAWGLEAFDRPNLLRENLLLRVSATKERWQPEVDWLVTPEDRGWVLTAICGWQGERLRLEGGLRIMGGPPGAAYRLLPGWMTYYVATEWRV